VRQVFHHLLLYRFYHQHRSTNTNLTNLEYFPLFSSLVNYVSDLRKEFLFINQKREFLDKTKTLLLNDYINITYARNMTIIENAYNKFTEEKKQQTYQKKFKSRVKPMPKLRYASAVNLTTFLSPEELQEAQPSQNTGIGKNELISDKSSIKPGAMVNKEEEHAKKVKNEMQAQDPNCIIIDPDKLENTKSIGIRPTRSESVSSNLVGVLEDLSKDFYRKE